MVVDNGVAPLEIGLMPAGVSVVREPVAGLSRARNTGAAAAANDVLVYLDDDARPAPGWIESLRDAFCDPRVAIAGGPINPLWPAERPAGWPAAGLESFFSGLSLGDGRPRVPRPGRGLRRQLGRPARRLAAVGGFDVRFGAGEGGALGGEEFLAATHVHRLGLGAGPLRRPPQASGTASRRTRSTRATSSCARSETASRPCGTSTRRRAATLTPVASAIWQNGRRHPRRPLRRPTPRSPSPSARPSTWECGPPARRRGRIAAAAW